MSEKKVYFDGEGMMAYIKEKGIVLKDLCETLGRNRKYVSKICKLGHCDKEIYVALCKEIKVVQNKFRVDDVTEEKKSKKEKKKVDSVSSDKIFEEMSKQEETFQKENPLSVPPIVDDKTVLSVIADDKVVLSRVLDNKEVLDNQEEIKSQLKSIKTYMRANNKVYSCLLKELGKILQKISDAEVDADKL